MIKEIKYIAKKIFSDKLILCLLPLSIIAIIVNPNNIRNVDLDTILKLSALLMLITIYQENTIFSNFALEIVSKTKTKRQLIAVVLILTSFGSMLLTNDIIILTMIPIIFSISKIIEVSEIKLSIIVTILANMGSSISPFGNPQNIYIISFYNLSVISFFKMIWPILILTVFITVFGIYFFKQSEIELTNVTKSKKIKDKGWIILVTTFLVILSVLNMIPFWLSIVFSIVGICLTDINYFKKIDYNIIVLFINFFLSTSLINSNSIVSQIIDNSINSNLSLFNIGVILSQVISNVPMTIILSNYTSNINILYLSASIGGLGTPVASLANLLAYRQILSNGSKNQANKFIKKFTILNFLILLIIYLLIIIYYVIS